MTRNAEHCATSEGLRSGDWGGIATFNGAIVVVSQPRAVVRSLLPSGLRLNEPNWPHAARHEHPIVFFLGEMTQGGAHWGAFRFSSGVGYREAAVMIPFVAHAAHPRSAVFPCQMFADDARPVLLGNSFYGLRKVEARIDWEGSRYEASTAGQSTLVCTGALLGPWSGCDAKAIDGLTWLRDTFALSIIGLRSSGQFVLLRFGWELDDAEARAMEARISWRPNRDLTTFHWQSTKGYSFAVRGMRWRTGALRPLSEAGAP